MTATPSWTLTRPAIDHHNSLDVALGAHVRRPKKGLTCINADLRSMWPSIVWRIAHLLPMLSAVVRKWRSSRHGVGTRRMLPLRDQEGRVVAEPLSGISGSWKKSSLSGGTDCVEVRRTRLGVQVRHSKNPSGAVLTFTDAEWIAFLRGVALGEFRIAGPTTECAI
jgi:hypothetical protein